MNVTQPFKAGDKVFAPSISIIIKQNTNEDRVVPATVVFAHPTNGWCSYKYDHVNVICSSPNEMIVHADKYDRNEELKKDIAMEYADDSAFENEYLGESDDSEQDDSSSDDDHSFVDNEA